ncbi:MAG: Tyrosine recombinase XerD [Candidatus Dichloromethanomonas elyunquensis]|nr:MAG: Tyrosine recombinase XerD [Candidatus Dichloromethanomonas elyunquensis]
MLSQISATAQLLLNDVFSIVWGSLPPPDELKTQLSEVFSCYLIRPAPVPEGHPDLTQKIDFFLAGKKLEGLSEQTLKGYLIDLRVFARHVNKSTVEITTTDIREYLQHFPHLKQTSISGKISVLKSFFGWLHNEEIITKNPMIKIRSPKKEKRLPKALGVDEFEMLREACTNRRERAIIEVFYSTGCRLSELKGMNKADIDWQSLTVRVLGKGNKERVVYLSFKAAYHLKKYLSERTDTDQALFVTERRPHHRLSNRAFERVVKAVAIRTDIPKNIYPHIIRHTFATDLLNNGAELAAVQALLGHADPATTQIYAVMSDDRIEQTHRKYHAQ